MTLCEFISKVDKKLRKPFVHNFPSFSCFAYSYFRKPFIHRLIMEKPSQIHLPENLRVKLWGIDFRSPLFNAAGMFKDGKGYHLACLQSAGAFLAGTVTPKPRFGNFRHGILHPFLPYPLSFSSSNWMGLPNPGYKKVIDLLNKIQKRKDIPLGLSLAADGQSFQDLQLLCEVLLNLQNSNVDFIELNESCPNLKHNDSSLSKLDDNFLKRLEFISENFLKKRNRKLPVILKLSNDFQSDLVPALLDTILDMQFDSVNFGNTSTNYDNLRNQINEFELKSFDYFISNFNGGVSGLPLKESSFSLTKIASEYLSKKNIPREFHIIRTGGIFEYSELYSSAKIGVSLFQWFTGYFENFATFGHELYLKFFTSIKLRE